MAANEMTPFYKPGQDITCRATAAITGKRLVKMSGNRESGPGLAATSEGSNYKVAQAGAGDRVLGVAKYDAAADGDKVGVATGGVVAVTAGGAIAAFAEVAADAAGKVVTKTAGGVAIGVALTAASGADVDAEILLYAGPTPGAPGTGNTWAQGTQQANIAAPSGGSTVDAEARAAIVSILAVLDEYGMTL